MRAINSIGTATWLTLMGHISISSDGNTGAEGLKSHCFQTIDHPPSLPFPLVPPWPRWYCSAMGKSSMASRVLAWQLDSEPGYRSSAEPQWRLVGVRELSQRTEDGAVDISDLAGEDVLVPSFSVRLLPSGELRYTSSVPMVVQQYGEPDSRVGQTLEDLGAGDVVRCGPLLVAVLEAEMANAMQRGSISLPYIAPAPTVSASGGVSGERIEAAKLRAEKVVRRFALVFLVGFVALTILAAGVGAALELLFRGGGGEGSGFNAIVILVPLVWILWTAIMLPIGLKKRAKAYREYHDLLLL